MPFDGTLKFDTAIDKKGFDAGLKNLNSLAQKGLGAISGMGDVIGQSVTKGLQITAGAVAAGTAAVAAIGKQALDAYADFEQLSGGVETLFGDAAQTVMDNAAKAFETAGMSANAYMETATASAAAMVNSLAGDTQKAAELTDMAVTDMADNINKMGTAAENVQNAYAGFAKGNFTMLDNLKLGYGGTKQEMERLLQTARELTGIEYSIDSYADIVQAIHAIQENMGITGTTAREASETISGSVAAVKAAWDNMLVGIADDTQDFDKLTDDLVTSAETAAGNILPRVEKIAGGVVKLIGSLGEDAVKGLTDALRYSPVIVDTGVQLIGALVDGVTDDLPALLNAGKDILCSIANGIIRTVPDLLDAANEITDGLVQMVNDPQITKRMARMGHTVLSALGEGLTRDLPLLLSAGLTVVQGLLDEFLDPSAFSQMFDLGLTLLSMLGRSLLDNLPLLLRCGGEILGDLIAMLSDPAALTALLDAGMVILGLLAQGIEDNLPALLAAAILILQTLGVYLAEHADELVMGALALVQTLLDLVIDNLPLLLEAAAAIIVALCDGITEHSADLLIAVEDIVMTLFDLFHDPEVLGTLWKAAAEILKALIPAAGEAVGDLTMFAIDLANRLGEAIAEIDWAALGLAILEGICSGLMGEDIDLKAVFSDFKDNWVTGIKDVFGIHSPSKLMRDEVGKFLGLGTAEGFLAELRGMGDAALDALRDLPALPDIEVGLSVIAPEEIPAPDGKPEPPDLPDPDGDPDPVDIPVRFDVDDLPLPDPDPVEISVGYDVQDLPDGMDAMRSDPALWNADPLRISIDPEALQYLQNFRVEADAVQALRDAMPSINAVTNSPVSADAASITNTYYANNITNNEQTITQESEGSSREGDIIIPVTIGGQNLDTVIIKAAQIANARSGGATI